MNDKSNFNLLDLFIQVAELSYLGDIWMKNKAENPNKVWNIVEPHVGSFFKYYTD